MEMLIFDGGSGMKWFGSIWIDPIQYKSAQIDPIQYSVDMYLCTYKSKNRNGPSRFGGKKKFKIQNRNRFLDLAGRNSK